MLRDIRRYTHQKVSIFEIPSRSLKWLIKDIDTGGITAAICVFIAIMYYSNYFASRLGAGSYLVAFIGIIAAWGLFNKGQKKLKEDILNSHQYPCKFIKYIYLQKDQEGKPSEKRSCYDVRLIQKITLPFPPSCGMSITDYVHVSTEVNEKKNVADKQSFLDGYTGFTSGKITNVIWYSGTFECSVESHIVQNDEDIGEVIVRHISNGWLADSAFVEEETTNAVYNFLNNVDKDKEFYSSSTDKVDEISKIRELLAFWGWIEKSSKQ